MLKFITPKQLRIGMYIQSFSGAWRRPPAWRKPFLLEKDKDLLALQASPIREIVIDIAKGADVQTDEAEQGNGVESSLGKNAEIEVVQALPEAGKRTDIQAERERAARIISSSEKTVLTMFSQARMGKTIDVKEASDLVREINASVSRNADAMISLVRLKTADNYTYMHSVAVCAMMISLADQLGLSAQERQQAGMAGLLHDIGKMTVPPSILNKPSKLTEEEFVSVQSHPLAGHRLLQELPGIGDAPLDVSLHHHEKMDGTGYPYKLSGRNISMTARMGAICDVYDAITSDRPYKSGWDPSRSIQHMAQSKGHFDFDVLQAFVKAVGIYPIGSCVLMQTGHLAIVLAQRPNDLLNPMIRIFYSTHRNVAVTPTVIDLRKSANKIVGAADPEKWGVTRLVEQQVLNY
ncbi:HD-GYP domain-containing protein [Herbaspirillum seropedicae]|uniref:HD-GYP domain-containing protein n=1 Tax=Herbaspirillum seropedicae TaxID=964 RepID=UPI0011228BE4|nr:HD-GYP domain-containing protein [Herbaspirillum seropedicae]QDD65070.1 HD-GYP domain-containing protein [Herbaspirillum seropedicae]